MTERDKRILDAMAELHRACGAGRNWMDQVSRAKLNSATRGVLNVDMGMVAAAMGRAQALMREIKNEKG